MIKLRLKVCLIGVSGVGKTSVTRRFVNNTFDPGHLETIGARIHRKRVGDVELVIWDLEGISSANLLRSYLRGVASLVVVTDGTNPASCTDESLISLLTTPMYRRIHKVYLCNKSDKPDFSACFPSSEIVGTGPQLTGSALDGEGITSAFREVVNEHSQSNS